MRKLVLTFIFFIISTSAFAGFTRSTSFDDREICEKDQGVWREFGNSLADNCESKFDQYSIAAQRITYACDCGKGMCWNGEHCVLMQDYKKHYDQIQLEEKKKLEISKKARQQEYRDNSNERLRALIGQKTSTTTNADGSVTSNNNMAQFSDKIPPDSSKTDAKSTANNVNQKVANVIEKTSEEATKVQESAIGSFFTFTLPNSNVENKVVQSPTDAASPATTSVKNNQNSDPTLSGPTPFFIQQQEKAKQEAEAAANNSAKTSSTTTAKDSSASTSLPALPQISLPQ
ncbi:MAG: hypothetical protein EBS06_05145 [Proteobacteria bacterium]|nr:hypothetical protein [Pseudomonadota bacterium]